MFGFGTEISTSSIYVDSLFTCFPSIKLMLSVCVYTFLNTTFGPFEFDGVLQKKTLIH